MVHLWPEILLPARGVSVVRGRAVFSGGPTQAGGETLMKWRLPPEASFPTYNSSPAALQVPAVPAGTQGQYVRAWRGIQTGVCSPVLQRKQSLQ